MSSDSNTGYMDQITARVETELVEEIDRRASEQDVSKSEVVRTLLEMGTEYEDLENERDRLRNQLQAMSRRQEEHSDLVTYVEEEREVRRRREHAPIWERARWWILGRPEDEQG